jgi:hypothetical protein
MKTTAKEVGLRFQFTQVGGQDLADVATDVKLLAADVQQFWIDLLGVARSSTDLPSIPG